MPLMPLASKSSRIRRCSAAVPSPGILNSTSTSGSSLSAFSQPFRAIVQKSEALLVTKATLNFLEELVVFEQDSIMKLAHTHTQASTRRDNFMGFSFGLRIVPTALVQYRERLATLHRRVACCYLSRHGKQQVATAPCTVKIMSAQYNLEDACCATPSRCE